MLYEVITSSRTPRTPSPRKAAKREETTMAEERKTRVLIIDDDAEIVSYLKDLS